VTLDIVRTARQVQEMASDLLAGHDDLLERVETARRLFREVAPSWQSLARRAESATVSWSVAAPVEPLDLRRPAPSPPTDYEVLATDGSQIEHDPHGLVPCQLVNVGWAIIRYGASPAAELASEPILYHRAEDLYLISGARQVPVTGSRLDARRTVDEMRKLATLAVGRDDDVPRLALRDGTLLLWLFEDRAGEFVREHFVEQFTVALDAIADRGVPIAGYVSRPRGTEVMGLLRLVACPEDPARCRHEGREPCARLRGLADRTLFDVLQDGERSALFRSFTPGHARYGRHQAHFFFLRVDAWEIARVEVPRWVAERPDLVDLVHACVRHQCLLGQGYPVALARAHERAVVRGSDRRAFEALLASTLAERGVAARLSAKSAAKRRHAV